MRIIFRCSCRQKISVRPKYAGKTVTCPKCSKKAQVPNQNTEPEVIELEDSDSDLLPVDNDYHNPYQQQAPNTGSSFGNSLRSLFGSKKARPALSPQRTTGSTRLPLLCVYLGLFQFLFATYHFFYARVFCFQTYRLFTNLGKLYEDPSRYSESQFDSYWSMVGVSVMHVGMNAIFCLILTVAAVGLLRSKTYGWYTAFSSAMISFLGFFYCIFLLFDYSSRRAPKAPRYGSGEFYARQMETYYNQLFEHAWTSSYYIFFGIISVIALCLVTSRRQYRI